MSALRLAPFGLAGSLIAWLGAAQPPLVLYVRRLPPQLADYSAEVRDVVVAAIVAQGSDGWVRPGDHVDLRVGSATLRDVAVLSVRVVPCGRHGPLEDTGDESHVTVQVSAREAEALRGTREPIFAALR